MSLKIISDYDLVLVKKNHMPDFNVQRKIKKNFFLAKSQVSLIRQKPA